MTRITENIIEAFAIELFDKLGYEYIYAPNIAPDGENPERETYEQVLLTSSFAKSVKTHQQIYPF